MSGKHPRRRRRRKAKDLLLSRPVTTTADLNAVFHATPVDLAKARVRLQLLNQRQSKCP